MRFITFGGCSCVPTSECSNFRQPVKTACLHQHPVATSTFFLFLPEVQPFAAHLKRSNEKKNLTKPPFQALKETAMKLSIIRSACGSLRIHPARSGSRVGGLSRRCLPVGPANSRLILRSASAASSGGTNPKIAVNFGTQSQKDGGFECDSSLR